MRTWSKKSLLNGNLTFGLFNPGLEIIFKTVPTSSVLFVDAAVVEPDAAVVEPEFKATKYFPTWYISWRILIIGRNIVSACINRRHSQQTDLYFLFHQWLMLSWFASWSDSCFVFVLGRWKDLILESIESFSLPVFHWQDSPALWHICFEMKRPCFSNLKEFGNSFSTDAEAGNRHILHLLSQYHLSSIATWRSSRNPRKSRITDWDL